MKSRMNPLIVVTALVALCLGAAGFAATSTGHLSGPAPTTYTDGSPLASTDLTGYNVDCQFTPAGSTATVPCTMSPSTITGPVLSGDFQLTYPASTGGKACFRAAAKTAQAVGPLGVLGPNSCRDVGALPPAAPGALSVTVTVTVTVGQ